MMGQPTTNGAGRADIRDRKKRTRAADQGLRALSLLLACLRFFCLSHFRVTESLRAEMRREETRDSKEKKKKQ